jgi:hypothetical protein
MSQPIDTGDMRADAEAALRTMLEQRRAPHGFGMFLKAARVADATTDAITLEMPESPGLERITSDMPVRVAIQNVLSELLGRRIELHVSAIGSSAGKGSARAPQRITPEAVRSEKLAALAGGDPTVKSAVELWDLEIAD